MKYVGGMPFHSVVVVGGDGEIFTPRQDHEKNLMVGSLVGKFRENFKTDGTLAPDVWDIAVANGASYAVANGALTLRAGLNAGSSAVLTGKFAFTPAARAMVNAMLSQRVAGQVAKIELFDESGDVVVGFTFDGASGTTAKCHSRNGIGTGRVHPAAGTARTVTSTATPQIYEIQAFPDEAWFFQRPPNNATGRAFAVAQYTDNIYDPGAPLRIRISIENQTAQTVDTVMTISNVLALDINELTVDLTNTGSKDPGQGVPVNLAGVNPSYSQMPIVSQNDMFADSTTNLAASGVFTGVSRDIGAGSSSHRGAVNYTATALASHPGTLIIDVSHDSTNWRPFAFAAMTQLPASLGAGWVGAATAKITTRYHRVRYVNDATAQTYFVLSSAAHRA